MSSDSSRSANSSGQRSKRVLDNSSPLNPSSSGGSKKKRINQKTLGVAWGANSISSSRPSSRKSPFSDFGSYMEVKNRKLHDQFNAEASNSSHGCTNPGNPIFQGVSIFVDGFTIPSSQELRGYMLKYGGKFENYFSRHRVSHIICSNLPDSKIKNIRSFSGGLPVVKPTWILDSVASNKLLSWVPYQLDQLASNQPRLSEFFSLKKGPTLEKPTMCMAIEKKYGTEDSQPQVAVKLKDTNSFEIDASIEYRPKMHADSETSLQRNATDAEVNEKPSDDLGAVKLKDTNLSEVDESFECKQEIHNSFEMLLRKDADVEEKKEPINDKRDYIEDECGIVDVGQSSEGNISSLHGLSASIHNGCFNNCHSDGSSSSIDVGSFNLPHSTLGNPDFVENYFKKSRLHFIGTWRNRYYKRFPRMPNGSNSMSSHINVSSCSQFATIIHVDMDCFFVSVVIRNIPEFKDKPVAVCHSDNPKGTAEISSANYPARGVKAGMFVRDAKALCPHLVIFPYDFKSYEEVADQFYDILHKHCDKVQAVSCDEAFLDITGSEKGDPEILASKIRKEIFDITGCTASAGIATNMLMARLATRTAKPDGQCYIPLKKFDDYLDQLPIKDLPGIGHALEEKLKKRNVFTCGQLRIISKDSLQKDFGLKTGEMLWNYSRGVDNRAVGVIQESKSIGAEVNWGVRFKDFKDCQCFLLNLCKEVSIRLQGCGVQGRTFTLKIKKRRKDADEPTKYMGCGDCENLSHSLTVPVATDDLEILQRIAKQLFGSFVIDVKEIRGIGLQVSKLQNVDISKQGMKTNSLDTWLSSSSATTNVENSAGSMAKDRTNIDNEKQSDSGPSDQLSADRTSHLIQVENDQFHSEALNQVSAPPLCHLDIGVIGSLPPELFSELNEIYGGKLDLLLAKSREKHKDFPSALRVSSQGSGEDDGRTLSDIRENKIQSENKHIIKHSPPAPISVEGFCNVVTPIPTSVSHRTDLLPSSLSQVDPSVLQELPEPLRADILKQLPAHRGKEPSLEYSVENRQESGAIDNTSGSIDSLTENDLWFGNPPLWVEKFKASNCLILKFLAEMYTESGSPRNLYGILLRILSQSWHPLAADGLDGAIYGLCELLKQYFKLKIEFDIEETYVCFRLLKRLALKSELFLEVFNIIAPYIQGAVNEIYGGNLKV